VIRRAAALALATALLAPAAATARERRVLVVTETRGFVHDSIPAALAMLRDLGRTSRDYDVVALPGARWLAATRLRSARAVVFLNTTGELRLPPGGRGALLAFVRGGGAVVGTHSAADTFHGWPPFGRMLGGEFRRHPAYGPGRLVVEDAGHPSTRTLPRRFVLSDEFYEFTRDPRCCAHVLVRLDTGRGGPDRPLVWCRREGRGRVFYDGLGHAPALWRDRRQRALVAGGLRWALGLEPAAACDRR
jgi:type 1 glutamine amidotransferase